MEKAQNFTEGRIFAPLIHFALPVIMMAAAPFLADMMHAPEEAYPHLLHKILGQGKRNGQEKLWRAASQREAK